jgi:hypothetical protein
MLPLSPEARAHAIELWVCVEKVLGVGGEKGGKKQGVREWAQAAVGAEMWARWEAFVAKVAHHKQVQSSELWVHPLKLPERERTKHKKEGTGWELQL